MLFLINWKLLPGRRSATSTLYGSMNKEDDAKDMGDGVEQLGRWCDLGSARGWAVARAETAAHLQKWIFNWSEDACDCVLTPICDDEKTREILGADAWKPAFEDPATEPGAGESVFVVEFAFTDKVAGYEAFKALTPDSDKADAGACRPLGRWHNIGAGTGVVVCIADDEGAVHKWASNWAALCNCDIHPVLTDAQARGVIRSKAGYEHKLARVRVGM